MVQQNYWSMGQGLNSFELIYYQKTLLNGSQLQVSVKDQYLSLFLFY